MARHHEVAAKAPKSKMLLGIWSEPHLGAGLSEKRTLCDGELSGPEDDSVGAGIGSYGIGDYGQGA